MTITFPPFMVVLIDIVFILMAVNEVIKIYIWFLNRKLEKLRRELDERRI